MVFACLRPRIAPEWRGASSSSSEGTGSQVWVGLGALVLAMSGVYMIMSVKANAVVASLKAGQRGDFSKR